MLFLIGALTCSLVIAQIFKVNEERMYPRWTFLTTNYFAAAGTAIVVDSVLTNVSPVFRFDGRVLFLGVATGLLFIGCFYLLAAAVRSAGMAKAVGVMRIAVVIPFLASWFFWRESPAWYQVVGVGIALAAFVLLAREPGRKNSGESTGAGFALLVLFVAGGLVDVSLKVFESSFGNIWTGSQFLLTVFGSAFFLGLGAVVMSERRVPVDIRRGAISLGLLLGVVNYASTDLVLRALSELPGTFVFPFLNIAVVVGAALIGRIVWGETLSKEHRAGVFAACLALLLLNL